MDAIKFLKEKKRMCNSMTCGNCPVSRKNSGEKCIWLLYNHPEKFVALVEEWSKEHPEKTRQSELLKLFPDAGDWNGVISICPKHLIKGYECPENGDANCLKCQERFWLEEI